MEDEKIIDLYWNRDQGAIGHTAEKYGSYCGRIAKNILLNKEDCEECVNDTWLRAWNAMPDERPAILSAFLGAITRNLSLDRHRKLHTAKRGKGEVEFIFDELTDQVDKKEPSHYIEEQELVACINHFLKNLPKEHRVMFVRRYWYFDNITEIAERCACSEGKVKTTLFRVRGKLLDYLKKEGYAL